MAILLQASLNRMSNAIERCFDCFVSSAGPLLVLVALGLISLCAHVQFTVVLPAYYGQAHGVSYWMHVLLSIYILIGIAGKKTRRGAYRYY